MNKIIFAVLLLIAASTVYAGYPPLPPDEYGSVEPSPQACTKEGFTRACTIVACDGVQTCRNGAWSSCVKTDLCCGVNCNDYSACTTDSCTQGVCNNLPIDGCILPSASPTVTSLPPSPTPPPDGNRGIPCNTDSECGLNSYCDGGYCTGCSFACVSDAVCVTCCSRVGRTDSDCVAPPVSPTPTYYGGALAGSPTPSPSVTPPPKLREVKEKIKPILEEVQDSGEDTSEIEDLIKKADELELQGEHEKAQGLLELAYSKLQDLLSKIRGSKAGFSWLLAAVLIIIVGGAAFFYTSNLQKQAEKKEAEGGEDYAPQVTDEFGESNPEEPAHLNIKRKKLDVE